jgi:hypothetical protein
MASMCGDGPRIDAFQPEVFQYFVTGIELLWFVGQMDAILYGVMRPDSEQKQSRDYQSGDPHAGLTTLTKSRATWA